MSSRLEPAPVAIDDFPGLGLGRAGLGKADLEGARDLAPQPGIHPDENAEGPIDSLHLRFLEAVHNPIEFGFTRPCKGALNLTSGNSDI